jgi:hypothetical protein
MPTLSASNSIFQLAFGVNAVLPSLISDFESTRKEAADSLLRKIKHYCPDFELKEQERVDFIDFSFRSTAGLRHGRAVTHATAFISLLLCAFSLAALCWAALKPEEQVSTKFFLEFVGVTLVGGPLLYVGRNAYLKWIYSVLVTYSTNEKRDAELFATCVRAYLLHKKEWEEISWRLDEVPFLIWKLRFVRLEMKLKLFGHRIRAMLPFKRNQ